MGFEELRPREARIKAELTKQFEKRLEFKEGPRSRVMLTLTPWEVRELVRRAMAVFEGM